MDIQAWDRYAATTAFDKRDICEVAEELGYDLTYKGYGEKPYATAFCLLHNNVNTPAFIIYPSIQRYACFGCGANGDVIDLTMRMLGISFQEAIKIAATPIEADEAFEKYVAKDQIPEKLDKMSYSIRAYNLFKGLDFLEANEVLYQMEKALEAGHPAEADLVLKRAGV